MNKRAYFLISCALWATATLIAASTIKPEVAVLFSFAFGFVMIIGSIDV